MYITTRFQSSHYNTIRFLHAFGLYDNRDGKLWHKKWSKKHKHVHRQESTPRWRQQGFFHAETNPQKKVSKDKKITGGPYTAKGYAAWADLFWFSFSRRHSLLYTHTTRIRTRAHTRKRLVTTPEGMLVRPCSRSHCFYTPARTEKTP